MEMIIVIAILAIMTGTITANTSSRLNRIREANSTAQDFYTTIQTEFTRFQMFDGPLTMSLSKKYNASPDVCMTSRKYGGMMWYPRAGGNYPVSLDASRMKNAGIESGTSNVDWRNKALPVQAGITIEVHVVNNKILSVDWAYKTADLFGKQPDEAGLTDEADINAARSELSAVLQMELDRKMDYKDGYYYARVVYNNDEAAVPGGCEDGGASSASIRAQAVTVEWAAYCRRQFDTADANTYTFRKAYTSNAGEIVGVVGGTAATGSYLGDTGTSFLAVSSDTTE